jgi:hypothetical protein
MEMENAQSLSAGVFTPDDGSLIAAMARTFSCA